MKSNLELIQEKKIADILNRFRTEMREINTLELKNNKDYAKALAKLKLIKEGK